MPVLPTLLNSVPAAFHGALPGMLERASEAAAASLFTILWQSILLAAVLTAFLKFAPRTTASIRFALRSAGFVAMVLLPLARVISLFWPAPAISSLHAASTTSSAPWLLLDARWSLAIAALWIAVSLYRIAGLAFHSLRLRQLWKSAAPVENQEIVTRNQTRRPVEICTTTQLDRPGVIGFFVPRILIPAWLYPQLSAPELKQIVLHELQHLRRRDDWTNLFQKLSLILFPLNPVLIWMEHQLCLEREMACDEGVIEATHAPRAYATCLTRLAERGIQHRSEALSLGAWQRRPELAHRVHSILRGKQGLPPRSTQVLMAGATCALVLGLVGFSRAPQLVGFVPAPTTAFTTSNTPYPATSRSVASVTTPAHLTEARAILPPRRRHAFDGSKNFTIAPSRPRPRLPELLETATPSATPAVNVAASSQPQEQWIVLTTWQTQVVPGVGYDASQLEDQPRPAAQAIVTQLVFRVIPQPAAEPKAKMNAQPVAIPANLISLPPRSGWLIFQL